MCECFICTYVCTLYRRHQKRVLDSFELALQIVVRYHVGSVNWTQPELLQGQVLLTTELSFQPLLPNILNHFIIFISLLYVHDLHILLGTCIWGQRTRVGSLLPAHRFLPGIKVRSSGLVASGFTGYLIATHPPLRKINNTVTWSHMGTAHGHRVAGKLWERGGASHHPTQMAR